MPSGAFTGNFSLINSKDAVHNFKFVNCSSIFPKANEIPRFIAVANAAPRCGAAKGVERISKVITISLVLLLCQPLTA